MTTAVYLWQVGVCLVATGLAPLFAGWVGQCRAMLQNRAAPPVWQPYRMLRKLFHKEATLATDASWLFRSAPYVVFAVMVLAAAIIPSLTTQLPVARVADAIALVGLFATARVFMALAAMDIGTAFGTLGARREMMMGFLTEPALLMVLFNAFLMAGTTALPAIVQSTLTPSHAMLHPSLAFAAVAFVMVLLAENARLPIDNPSTHLELTMIHEAMVLEYSARHLALMEWASWLKLFNYACIGFTLFMPWGIATQSVSVGGMAFALLALVAKLLVAGSALALFETTSAKLRLFRAPEFLTMAFLLAVLGLLVHLLLEG
ncbi:respiratory chain complex I subunit 1 family protein [Dyella nitratireducens]|uniref:Formate hydrogenlyase subunit 4 n=1 Tax=Dyella nitratireducens TaxID=1849580 RepID=A0ABQ1GVB7_9GAMM|nr:NADH-quinone oxidoreductase subunit H [Dyella nitratireducens]GGA50999.1 formate hydrogenlyase subunit 4 [Dyella nitratireducens]GLQ42668.1 formate hydrogenlyase subunit 4 [Dyella nitratireducens]